MVVLGTSLFGSSTAAQAANAPAVVTLVHGVRGLVADVYLDSKLAITAFQPERSTDPLELPAGTHVVDVRAAGAAQTADPLLHAVVKLAGGSRQSAVVHLDVDGKPTISRFDDDLSRVPAGTTRVVVRHAAAVGTIDVTVDSGPGAAGLSNGHETVFQIAAGTHQLGVVDPPTGAAIAPPQGVPLAEGSANFLYLIGSQREGSLGWAAVKVSGLQTAPARIQTGDGSLAATPSSSPRRLALAIGGGMAAFVAALTWRRPRRVPQGP